MSERDKSVKPTYRVILTEPGRNIPMTILIVRKYTNLNLSDAKKLIDNLPIIVQNNLSEENATQFKTEIEALQGKVIIEDDNTISEWAKLVDIEPRTYTIIIKELNYNRLSEIMLIAEGKINPNGLDFRDFVDCMPYKIWNLKGYEAENKAKSLKELGCNVIIIKKE